MNRELKFRAWDEGNLVMHYDFEFIRSGVEGNDWIVFKSDKQPLNSKPHPFENPFFSQQLKIIQYTGLSDKHGKEIFEGDVVAKYVMDFSSPEYEVWVWNQDEEKEEELEKAVPVKTITDEVTLDHFRYWLKKESFGWEGEGMEDPSEWEVIGNIYQHPELLNSIPDTNNQ